MKKENWIFRKLKFLTIPLQIPFFPVVKKDLTFIHLGNDSKVESLVNFEKLRMIAKEIRHTCNMASAQYVSTSYSLVVYTRTVVLLGS